tara:strand:- start:91 stop:327 length:237 start_codon:yes stop_codon:yes gene_type:complete
LDHALKESFALICANNPINTHCLDINVKVFQNFIALLVLRVIRNDVIKIGFKEVLIKVRTVLDVHLDDEILIISFLNS